MQIKVPRFVKIWLYCSFITSALSGIAFFVLSRFIQIEGEFGPMQHPLQYPLLQIHGFCAFMLLMLIGAFLINHVPASWKVKSRRNIGLMLAIGAIAMALTAYALYYLASDSWREGLTWSHMAIGAGLPILMMIHRPQRQKLGGQSQTIFGIPSNPIKLFKFQ